MADFGNLAQETFGITPEDRAKALATIAGILRGPEKATIENLAPRAASFLNRIPEDVNAIAASPSTLRRGFQALTSNTYGPLPFPGALRRSEIQFAPGMSPWTPIHEAIHVGYGKKLGFEGMNLPPPNRLHQLIDYYTKKGYMPNAQPTPAEQVVEAMARHAYGRQLQSLLGP